jgi:hypothetical protein
MMDSAAAPLGVAVYQTTTGFQETGLVDLSDFGTPEMWESIIQEAMACEPDAKPRIYDTVKSFREGSLSSPCRARGHSGGEALIGLSRNRDFIMRVREATGFERLVPTNLGYQYYRQGDFLGLHRDTVRCTVTVTFGLTQNMGHMYWLPALRDAGNDELVSLIERCGLFPEGGEAVPVEFCKMKAFDGYSIPHWRPAFEHELGILGTICFFDL